MDPEFFDQLQEQRSDDVIESQTTPNDSDSSSGNIPDSPTESLTGQSEQPFSYASVPNELKTRRQWVVWLYHTKEGDDKPSKVLYQTNGWAARSQTDTAWTDYKSAVKCYAKHKDCLFDYRYRETTDDSYQHLKGVIQGIGFVFSKDDPYCGIDLDDCLDSNNDLKEWAAPIVDRLKSVAYGEVSPSGTGIKFWTKAKLPDWMNTGTKEPCEDGAIEAYHFGRYFTVTGRGKGQIKDGQSVADWLVSEYLTPVVSEQRRQPPAQPATTLNASEVIEKIRNSASRYKFDALMKGDISGYHHKDGKPDQSRADCGLCGIIAFWTQDEKVIDSIFRTSGLMRTKWDEIHKPPNTTYGAMTIAKALSGNKETYTPLRGHSTQRRNYRHGYYTQQSLTRRRNP